uniref:CARD domain-containing protein n=1 Tax=Sus scrofa TaxID=9823 RepID=A0A8D0XH02_PIG
EARDRMILWTLRLEALGSQVLASGINLERLFKEIILTQEHKGQIKAQQTGLRQTMGLLDLGAARGKKIFFIFLDSSQEFPLKKEKKEKKRKEKKVEMPARRDMVGKPPHLLSTTPNDYEIKPLLQGLGPDWVPVSL